MQIGQGTDLSLCWPFNGLCVSIILAFIAGGLRGGWNHDHRQQVDERSPFDPTAFSLALSAPLVLLTPAAHFLMSSLEPFSLALCPSLQASLPTPSSQDSPASSGTWVSASSCSHDWPLASSSGMHTILVQECVSSTSLVNPRRPSRTSLPGAPQPKLSTLHRPAAGESALG